MASGSTTFTKVHLIILVIYQIYFPSKLAKRESTFSSVKAIDLNDFDVPLQNKYSQYEFTQINKIYNNVEFSFQMIPNFNFIISLWLDLSSLEKKNL